ncbi:hypothetical protein F8388_007481 [Cannabis sativa]|uniref:AAA+ ATPase domain-containing protein n=1 Tax=Cannabis sativa TaxID=3483 RepID=A0A7J6F4X3_CANSA|nr:hypothetical protein F8388_007481 [Cannabis sativa]
MASSPNLNPSLTYLLVLADTVLEWLRLLDNEEFPVYKSTVADYLSRLENDLWFVHASFQQGGLVVLNSHDHENLLRSSLELVMKMWKKALETRYVFPNKKVVTFMNSVSEPLTVLCHEFEDVTKKLHSSLPNTIINSSGESDEAKFIVGRENDKAEIMKLINKNNFGMGEKNARVITIFGDSGIGKTTLVRNIYKDMEKKRFHKCIWVSMGGNYNSGLIEIIRQLLAAGGDVPAYNRDDVPKRRLLEELGKAIDKKKCFIVIDDLIDDMFRNTENYNLLSFLGIRCAWGTRVLVTTRSEKLADELRTSSAQPYRLGPLNGEASWDVFRRRAFVGLNEEELSPELLNQLEILLRNEIRHKRYLLILDDVWNEREEKWKSLMALMSYGNGSRIIVTTRSRKVAEITSEKKERLSHELKRLDEDYAWLLFVKVAFEQGEHPSNDEIEKIGLDIVRKCEGIPLLIRTIASMLFFKNPEEEWQRFYDEKLSEILENASDVLKTLELSYLTLEKSLQLCFAYCGLFPKDYEFEFRWAIEGRSNDDSICDVILKFKWLKMLDLHNSGIKVLPDSIGELKNLGYLDLSQNVNIKSLPSCIGELKNLQTLKLNHCSNLRELPSGITKLNGLRNLENESCSLTHMPKGLHKLSKLRRLSEFVLDKGIERSLPELVLDKCIDSLPKKILPESVLNKYSVSKKSGKLNELSDLNELRGKLKLTNLRFHISDKTSQAYLFKKKHLSSLTLSWDIDEIVEEDDCEKGLEDLRPHRSLREFCLSGYGGRNFPKWLSSLKNLVKLSLSKCNKCQFLPPLEHFSKLEVLIVDELMKLQYIVENKSTTTFSSLKEIRLTNLPEVKGWYWNDAAENVEQEEEEEEATFTCLSKLVVEDCPNLTSMPLFPCLEELLLLKNTSWKPFKQTMALAATQEASSSSSSSSGSSFKQTIVSNKGKEIQQPNELKKPSSTTCSTVAPLSKLRTLHIINMSNGDPNMWQSLHSLRSVTLDHIADINDQLQGLRQVKSLQQLRIWRCDSLEEIPSWINDSNSLKTISIKLCPKLTVSRDKLSLIISSKKVEIEDCPRLSHIATMLKDPLYTQ